MKEAPGAAGHLEEEGKDHPGVLVGQEEEGEGGTGRDRGLVFAFFSGSTRVIPIPIRLVV